MRKSLRILALCQIAALLSVAAISQTVTLKGTVRNTTSKETVPAVSVTIKGSSLGTFTDENGNFSITTPSQLPVTLVFSSVGYDTKELSVSNAETSIELELQQVSTLGQEVVMAASRAAQRSLDAPVTVERLGLSAIRNAPAPNYYEALSNLKGVDVHTASLTFRTITTRGFVASGNTRLNQLVDGMDNQAPGLNFSVSAIVGLTEPDVENVEILSGASSALYGSGGMNGTVLISSKNPFKYQGLSMNIKQGVMHVDGKQTKIAPYYNWSTRWAKAFNNKVAIKFTGELLKGSDWQAEDYRNKALDADGLFGVTSGDRATTPNYNGINTYGDETSFNMNAFSFYVQDQTRRGILAATGGAFDVINNPLLGANAYFMAIGSPQFPTDAQLNTYYGLLTANGLGAVVPTVKNMMPFYNGYKNNYFGGASITRTGYKEEDLVDYNSLNVKLTGAVHWKINDHVEASWNSYFGTGTTVYTGANRYSLRDFKVGQHKLEFKARDWFVRGYTTQENAGGSFIGDAVGSFMNEAYSPSSIWIPTYITYFSEGKRLSGGLAPNTALHMGARSLADVNRYQPGSAQFIATAKQIENTPVDQPGGSKFLDRSDLWSVEGQLNLSDALKFSDKIEVIMGAQWKEWVLDSKGTIFADTAGTVKINETGGYIQLKKKLFDEILTLTASGRYDKQTNFDGKFTPRIAAVIRVAKDNNVRLSYQSAYRFPVNQDQYISLRLGGGTNYLIGSLPEFQSFYRLNSQSKPGYSIESALNYRAHSIADSNLLQVATYKELKPETVKAYEIGYKGLWGKKLLFDFYIYYSQYSNFLVNQTVIQATHDNANYEVYSEFSSNSLTYKQNTDQKVKSLGWGLSVEYNMFRKYMLYGNIFSDKLKNLKTNEVTFFNAPKYRFNIGLRNDAVWKNIGFNIVLKWQGENYYEGTFVKGTLPSFAWIDGQVSYRVPKTKSVFRIGGTNLGNNYQRTGFGSPYVGGLYYVSYGFNM